MSVILTWQRSSPGQPQFGLDTLTETYKVQNDDGSQITAADVMTDGGVPQRGDAHPDFATMFCTDRHCIETGDSASAIDIIYTGTLSGSLPPQQHSKQKPIQSASSSTLSSGLTLASPATIQFYARSNVLNYISAGGPGSDVADDPTEDLIIINYTVGQAVYSSGGFIDSLIPLLFSVLITETPTSTEIVAGQYWQNTSTKTKTYTPFLFDLPTGPFLLLASPGDGYSVGDTLTCTVGGESAVVVLTVVGGIQGTGVLAWTVTSNTFTAAHSLMVASGGTGTGAEFNVVIFP